MNSAGALHWIEGLDRRREALLFALWALWLCGLSLMGPWSWVVMVDEADAHVPLHIAASAHPSFLFPFQGSGVDLLATGNFNDIDALLFFVLPPWLVCGMVLFLQRFIAGVFAYRLLHEDLRLSPVVALFGALEFAALMSGFGANSNGLISEWLFSLPLIPAILWLLPRIAACERRSSYMYVTALGVLVAVSTLFFLQLPLFPTFVVWFWLVVPQRSRRFWGLFAAFFAAYIAVELPSILISLVNAVTSHRADWSTRYMSGTLERLAGLGHWASGYPVQLAFTIGGAACFLSEGRCTDSRPCRRLFAAALGYLCFLRLFSLLYPLFWAGFWQYLPVIRAFQIERIYLAESFLVTVTACLGLQLMASRSSLLNRPGSLRLSTARLATAGIVLVLAHSLILQGVRVVHQFSGRNGGFNFTTLFSDANVLRLRTETRNDPPFRVEGSGVHPAMLGAYGLESAGGMLPLYPRRYMEFWTQVIRPLETQDPDLYRYFSEWGNRIYLFHPPFNMELLSLANVRFIASVGPVDLPGLELVDWTRPTVELERKWRIAATREKLFSFFRDNYPGLAPYIYENKRYLPRVFSVDSVLAFDSKEAILEGLGAAALESLAASVFLEKDDAAAVPGASRLGKAQVRIVRRSAGEWLIATEGERPTVLVVTNSFNPFWRAYVDGNPTRVMPAYHAFQAVPVPAGKHEVAFRYEPPYRIFRDR